VKARKGRKQKEKKASLPADGKARFVEVGGEDTSVLTAREAEGVKGEGERTGNEVSEKAGAGKTGYKKGALSSTRGRKGKEVLKLVEKNVLKV